MPAPPTQPGVQPTSLLAQLLPSITKLAQDRAAWEKLSPAEQQATINLLRSIPTPPAVGAREAGALGMLEFMVTKLGRRPTQAAIDAGYALPITPDQQLIVESVERNKRTAVTSGHGIGKTRIAADIALAFLHRKPHRRVITTATTWEQVEAQLWAEIRAVYAGVLTPLPGRLLTTKLEIAPDWFMVGLSTRDYSKFSGHHAENGVLVVIDEATGVLPEVASAAESLILGPDDRLLAIGNPTDPSSWFKEATDSPLWHHITVSCYTHPNVIHKNPYIIPGAVTWEWIQDQITALGEDSPLFSAKVLGKWPDSKQDALIQSAWVSRAQSREPFPEDFKGTALGCDIAGPGGDLFTIWKITNRKCELLAWRQRMDYMHGVGLLVQFSQQYKARVLVIDDTGVGGAVSSRLREIKRTVEDGEDAFPQDCRIVSINFGASAPQKHVYNRFKDQLWWSARELLKGDALNLPTDREHRSYTLPRGHSFFKQILAPIYRLDSSGRVDVYDQRDNHDEQTKLLPTQSPDLAHGWILACFGWRMLREDRTPAPPQNPVEATTQEFHEAMRARVKDYTDGLARSEMEETEDWGGGMY